MTADSQVKETGYAPVNDLNMYYEIRGSGTGSDVPLVLIHGSFMTVEAMEPLVQAFVGERRVIVPEMQGHGRTNDVDRPLTYQQMADDTAGLLRHLGVERADIAGYSLGGGVAWQVAIRHPELVRKLVPIGIVTDTVNGAVPEYHEAMKMMSPEMFTGSPWKEVYDRVAPDPGAFPALVEKTKGEPPYTWPSEEIRAIPAPTLLIFGDAEGWRMEHAAELFRLRGGGVGLPVFESEGPARLAVLPGTTHLGILNRIDWLKQMIIEFLDAPMPETA